MNQRLVLIFLFFSFSAFTQIHKGIKALNPYAVQIDSLNEQLRSDPRHFPENYNKLLAICHEKNDSALLSFLYVLQGSYHFYLSNKDSAKIYFEKSINIADAIGNQRIVLIAQTRRIFCDEYEKTAAELSRRMFDVFTESYSINDTINMIYSLNGLGLFYDRMDSTALSIKCHNWALNLAEKGKYKFEEAFILNNLGLLKLEKGLEDSAYVDFMKGMNIAAELNNIRLECHLRENLGTYYLELDSIDAARYEFDFVLDVGVERGYKDLELSSLINLANLEQIQQNYSKSDSLYWASIRLAKNERMFHALSPLYLGMVQLYNETNRANASLALLDSSLVYAEFSSPLTIRLAYLSLKSKILESTGRIKESFEVYKAYKQLNDSAQEVQSFANVAEMQLRFNDEKKALDQLKQRNKLEVELKQKEIDLATFRQRLFLVITFSVIILALILIYYAKQKQKHEREFSNAVVNKLEEERGRIARDLHDGVGQSLIILKNKMTKTNLNNEQEKTHIDENFSEIIEEIRSISRSLIPPELKRLGLRKAIENRLNEIANTTGILVTTEITDLDQLTIPEHQSLRLYRIVQELSSNTVKHAEATAIKIEAEVKGDELVLIYHDNGKGFEKEAWLKSENTVGLRSIIQRLNYLKGTIKIERPKKGIRLIMKIQFEKL